MGQAQAKPSLEEFIAWENGQDERHEFVRGEVFAMVGARRVHGQVCLNLAASLKAQLNSTPRPTHGVDRPPRGPRKLGAARRFLGGSRCAVFMESLKLQIGRDALVYPDVFVTCDPADLRTEQVFAAPTVVAEVLSPSTQAYDRGLKFTLYRSLQSLREYVLVDPQTREVLVFRRGAEGLFTLHDMSGLPQVELASIGCIVPAAELFEGIEPEA